LASALAISCGSSDDVTSPSTSLTIQSGTLIELQNGKVQGDVDGKARRFRGIPYAKPPAGDLRWKEPEPVGPWQDVLAATNFKSPCPQPAWIQGPRSLEEDCLYLNVWTPDPAPMSPLPVMVWLPGGGNQNGSASDNSPLSGGTTIYEGRDLASTRNVVVVTINYRIGVMGFFAHAGLRAEGSNSGNQGLLDQQLALKWVRDNIVAFGGDAKNVTLFGESAGSQDTCLQVVSPGARGLFHRAISESGGCTTFRKRQSDAEQQVEAFVQAVGCSGTPDEIACLRGKSVSDLLVTAPVDGGDPTAPGGSQFSGGTPRWDFNPVAGDGVLPDQPRTLVENGDFAKVPYLLGSNIEEGQIFFLGATPVTTEAEYSAALQRLFSTSAASVEQQYPVTDFATPQDALVRVWGDYRLVCTTYDSARRVLAHGSNVFMYNFARNGATHGFELPYVFGTLSNPGSDDANLSDSMQGYWTRFADKGDPNGESAIIWPAFDATNVSRINFDVPSSAITGFRRTQCDFWGTIYDAAFQ